MTLSHTQRRFVRSLLGVVATIIAIPLLLVLAWFAYSRYVIWRYDQPFEAIARGDTEKHVIALLGEPHRIAIEHQRELAWRSGQHEEYSSGDCVVQFRYIPWSPTGDTYVVGFDPNKHVVAKYELTSP